MPVPAFRHFLDPLLRYLADHPNGVHTKAVYDALSEQLGLTSSDQAEMLPSGRQAIYRNRIGWAHDWLKRRGWSSSPSRGIWRITEAGRAFVDAHPEPLSEPEIAKLQYVPKGAEPLSSSEGHTEEIAAATASEDQVSPEEKVEHGLEELQESVGQDLLERVMGASPLFFETLVLDLLHSMGYGTSRADIEHVGGSGDGGIDGIISLDRLGLEKVYVQAKRWKDKVS